MTTKTFFDVYKDRGTQMLDGKGRGALGTATSTLLDIGNCGTVDYLRGSQPSNLSVLTGMCKGNTPYLGVNVKAIALNPENDITTIDGVRYTAGETYHGTYTIDNLIDYLLSADYADDYVGIPTKLVNINAWELVGTRWKLEQLDSSLLHEASFPQKVAITDSCGVTIGYTTSASVTTFFTDELCKRRVLSTATVSVSRDAFRFTQVATAKTAAGLLATYNGVSTYWMGTIPADRTAGFAVITAWRNELGLQGTGTVAVLQISDNEPNLSP